MAGRGRFTRKTHRPDHREPLRRRGAVAGQAGHAPPAGRVIRRSFDIVTTDVIVRDNKGQFIADLKKDDFEVYEDGVKQDVVSFVLTHGGRVYNVRPPPAPPPMEGIILPPSRPTNDAAGRIWMIFVDDLHLDFRTPAASRICSRRSPRSWFTKATCSASCRPVRRRWPST